MDNWQIGDCFLAGNNISDLVDPDYQLYNSFILVANRNLTKYSSLSLFLSMRFSYRNTKLMISDGFKNTSTCN